MTPRGLLRLALAFCWLGCGLAHASGNDAAPRRIVSICLQGDQLLLRLVPRERVLALSSLAADPDLSVRWEQAKGYRLTRGGAEELARLRPDLILVSSFTPRLPVELLKRAGARVLELGVPNDFGEMRALILEAGRALGEPERAEAWMREMDARLERLKARREALRERPTAVFYFQDGFVPGEHTFANAILEAAGFTNLGARIAPGIGAPASLETVVLARPQYLILTRYRADHPAAQNQLSTDAPIFARLGPQTEVVRVPFRHLGSPDPDNLELAEQLQARLFP